MKSPSNTNQLACLYPRADVYDGATIAPVKIHSIVYYAAVINPFTHSNRLRGLLKTRRLAQQSNTPTSSTMPTWA